MLIYIHVPYCRRKCRYCSFHSAPADGVPESYIRTLLREIAFRSAHLHTASGRPQAETVYFGGGTPSLLSVSQIGEILGGLRSAFDIGPDAEITLECNPESLGDVPRLRAIAGLGVNRISLGVQSLDDAALRFLGRPHDAAQAVAAYDRLRQAGFANLSLDVMWGLPGRGPTADPDAGPNAGQDTLADLADLARFADLAPEHLSRYCLSVDPGTPLAAARDLFRLPGESSLEASFLAGSELLESRGYRHYEISNFARPGRESRHNSGYWRGQDYLGFGPAAVSTVNGLRRSNPADQKVWTEVADKPESAWTSPELADLLEDVRPSAVEELVMLALRTAEGLDLDLYRRLSGADFVPPRSGLLTELVAQGLAVLTPDRLRLTRRGFVLADEISARLL